MMPADITAPARGDMRKPAELKITGTWPARFPLLRGPWAWLTQCGLYEELRAIFASYPEIFFIQNGWIGLAFFAVTMTNPSVGGAGIVAVVAAYAFARFLDMDREFLRSGFYTYNPLLVGLALGHKLQFTPLACLMFSIAGIFAFILALGMANLFSKYLRLPVLSLPFVIVSWCAYMASYRYSNLLIADSFGHVNWIHDPLPPQFVASLPPWVTGYFYSFGAILFEPNVAVGLFIAILVVWKSRILFLLSLWGFYVGVSARALMCGSFNIAAADVNNYNFILVGMAVGCVYVVPSVKSYVLAAVAVIVSILIFDSVGVFCAPFHLPAFTLPFNFATLTFLFVLELLQSPLYARYIGRTPEETLENEYANRMRYQGQFRTLFLPFSGRWTVWQGFDGRWTHKGNWRYAYDFVITGEDGKTHSGDGSKLEDYHCYNKPVLSPVRGRIVQLIDDVPDSKPGEADKIDNWGNALVILDYRGFHVEISHFAEKSMRVKVGDTVERGTVLGLCGNSGYSPQPHVHIQVQIEETIGAASLPFSFVSYATDGKYFANDCPAEKQTLEPLYTDKRLDAQTSFVLDEVYNYALYRNEQAAGHLNLTVKMAPDGTFYFDSGNGRLYFGKHEGTFYFYRVDGNDAWLRMMQLSLPRMPLSYRPKLSWTDFVPAGVASSGLRKMLVQLLSSFVPGFAAARVTQCFAERRLVQCRLAGNWFYSEQRAAVTLDDAKGFSSFKLGDLEIRRIENDNPSPNLA